MIKVRLLIQTSNLIRFYDVQYSTMFTGKNPATDMLQLILYLRQLIFFFCFNFLSINYHTQKQKENKNYLR